VLVLDDLMRAVMTHTHVTIPRLQGREADCEHKDQGEKFHWQSESMFNIPVLTDFFRLFCSD